jgi:hypothetical protein
MVLAGLVAASICAIQPVVTLHVVQAGLVPSVASAVVQLTLRAHFTGRLIVATRGKVVVGADKTVLVVVVAVAPHLISSLMSAILLFITVASAAGIFPASAYFVIEPAVLSSVLHALPDGMFFMLLRIFLLRASVAFAFQP